MDEGQIARVLSTMVEESYESLYRYAYRLTGKVGDAEDLTQQAFLTAQAKLDQLRDPRHSKAWLFAILRNAFLKDVRNRGGVAVFSLENLPEPCEKMSVRGRLEDFELQEIISDLPEEFRTPLILFYFEEFSYKEIAKQMDVPIGTIMSRLARAKAYLRGRLAAFQPAMMDR